MESADHLAWMMPPSPAREEAGDLHRCAERGLATIRELLRPGAPPGPAPYAVDVNLVVVPAIQTLMRLAGDRVRVRLRFAEEAALVMAEVPQMERIVLNLALNARDAMAGEGVMTISTEVVRPHVRLTVTDTGSGMTPDRQARIFEPYFSTKKGAIGLGLSAVSLTVSQLRGSVTVESELNRGTTVSVLLPLATPF
jgi:signal transduction histidine kinase